MLRHVCGKDFETCSKGKGKEDEKREEKLAEKPELALKPAIEEKPARVSELVP